MGSRKEVVTMQTCHKCGNHSEELFVLKLQKQVGKEKLNLEEIKYCPSCWQKQEETVKKEFNYYANLH